MDGGILVATGVVGALALFETVLPWAFAALRKWRRGQAETAEEKNAGGFAISPGPSHSANDAALEISDSVVATEGSVVAGSENSKIAYRASDRHSNEAEAQRLWAEARKMKHRAIPSFRHDGEYLKLVNAAAAAGCMEAMDKLGTYAFRRQAFVEAFYWKLAVRLRDGETHEVGLKDVRIAWMACGCPMQHRNVYEGFGEEQGVFARAVLKIQCGIDVARAKNRIRELVKAGNPYAIRFDGLRRPLVYRTRLKPRTVAETATVRLMEGLFSRFVPMIFREVGHIS